MRKPAQESGYERSMMAVLLCGAEQGMVESQFCNDAPYKKAAATLVRKGVIKVVRRERACFYATLIG